MRQTQLKAVMENLTDFNPRIVRKRCDVAMCTPIGSMVEFQSTHHTQTMRLVTRRRWITPEHFNPRIVRKRCDLRLLPQRCRISHFNPRIVRKRCDVDVLTGIVLNDIFQSTHRTQTMRRITMPRSRQRLAFQSTHRTQTMRLVPVLYEF